MSVKPGRQSTVLDHLDYAGKTTPPTNRLSPCTTRPTCQHCGSSLTGRLVGTRKHRDGLVDVYLCPCLHRREVRHPT